MSWGWFGFVILFMILYILRSDLRKEMLISGLLSLPILFIKPFFFSSDFFVLNDALAFFKFIAIRAIFGFSFGGVAAAIYESFGHKFFTPEKHPKRDSLIILSIGLAVFFAAYYLRLNFSYALILGLVVNILLILMIRFDLIYDTIFSGASTAVLYVLLFTIEFYAIPGEVRDFWFTDKLSGINFLTIPIEEIIIIALFGAFFGPLYVAIKDLHQK